MRQINKCRKNVGWVDQELRRQTDARTPSKKQRWIQSRLRRKANLPTSHLAGLVSISTPSTSCRNTQTGASSLEEADQPPLLE